MARLEDLIIRWHLGWRASRTLPAADVSDDGLWIHCAQPSREFEVLALHADEDPASLPRLAAQVLAAKEHTWLTVTTNHPAQTTAALEATGLEILHRSEWLMTTDLTRHPRHALDAAYMCDIRTEPSVIAVSIHDRDGELAARGQIGLTGTDAVADRIETMPNHRRRGLGRAVMSALATEAAAHGAHTGLLIASADGQHLYSALGWERVADVVIARSPAA
jgi:GNAT superfamily N-acetyltransferase